MNKFLEIWIVEPSQQGNIGILLIDGHSFCWTMTRDYTDEGYAIPEGLYLYKRATSNTYGDTFEIIVEGHTLLYFHTLNTENQSKGCVGLGEYPGKLNGKRAVLNSGNTIERFMKEMKGVQSGWIRIQRK